MFPPIWDRRRQTPATLVDRCRTSTSSSPQVGAIGVLQRVAEGTDQAWGPGGVGWEDARRATVGEDELLKCPCGAYASNVECAVGTLPAAVTTPAADPAALARAIAASAGADVRIELVEWPRPPPPPSDPPATTPSALLQSPPPPSDDMTLLVLGPDRRGNPFKLKSLRPAWAAPFGEPTLRPVAPAFLADALAIDDARAPVTLLVDASALATLGALAPASGNGPAPVRTCTVRTVGDFRTARAGDICPRSGTPSCLGGSGPLGTVRGIEVGHAFYLDDKYSAQVCIGCARDPGTARRAQHTKYAKPLAGSHSSPAQGKVQGPVRRCGDDGDGLLWAGDDPHSCRDRRSRPRRRRTLCTALRLRRLPGSPAAVRAAVWVAGWRLQGLVWPAIVAPYRLCIVVAGNPKDATYLTLAKAAEQLYDAASTHVPGLSYVGQSRLLLLAPS